MNITMKKINSDKMPGVFEVDDGTFIISGKIVKGPDGYFVSLPSEQYKDKEGKTKYKNLVKISGDKSRYFAFNEYILNEAKAQGII